MYRPQKKVVPSSAYSLLEDIKARETVLDELNWLAHCARIDTTQVILENIVNRHLGRALQKASISDDNLGEWLNGKWLDEIVEENDEFRKVMKIVGGHWSDNPQGFGDCVVTFMDVEDQDNKRLESLVWFAPMFGYIRLQFRWLPIVIND